MKARIDALEKKGIIEEYTTIINPQKISGAVSCYFEIEAEPRVCRRLKSGFAAMRPLRRFIA